MDWNAPERRRKLVTYGKSSQKEKPTSQGKNSRSQASVPSMNVGIGIGASAKLPPHLHTQAQEPETSHDHRVSNFTAKERISTRIPKDEVLDINDLTTSRDDIQNTLRSPKRRRISTERQEHPSLKGNSRFSTGQLPSRSPVIAKRLGSPALAETSVVRQLLTASSSSTIKKEHSKRIVHGTESLRKRVVSQFDNQDQPISHSDLAQPFMQSQDDSSVTGPANDSLSTLHLLPTSNSALNSEVVTSISSSFMPIPDAAIGRHEEASPRKRLVDSLGAQEPDSDNSLNDIHENDRPSKASEKSEDGYLSKNIPTTPKRPSQHSEYGLHQGKTEIVDKASSPQSTSSKITYARQRSFLSNLDLSEAATANTAPDVSFGAFSLPDEPSSATNTGDDELAGIGSVRSIHELRRAGVNARFQGAVDSIFEDVEDSANSVSVRRNGLVQLCEKLLDPSFAQRFVESGAFRRLSNSMSKSLDDMSSYLTICAYTLILCINPIPSSVCVAFWPRLLVAASSLLRMEDDIPKLVRQRRFGLSRVSQAAIRDIARQIRNTPVLVDYPPIWNSPQQITLRAMQLTVRGLKERDFAHDIPDTVLYEMTRLLLEHSTHTSDLEPFSQDFLVLESIISILESCTTILTSLGKTQQDALKPLTQTSHLLFILSKMSDNRSKQLLILQLRLILNITNNNPYLCDDFATPGLIHGLVDIVLKNYQMASGDFIGEKKDSLDTVILSLGALINLTEESETARKSILSQEAESLSLLHHLLRLFSMGLDTISEADSVVQTHSNVAFGYLSILLCMACVDRDIRSRVRESLNGTGLTRIIATVEEFLLYHRKVDEELHHSQALVEFTARLQGILNHVREIDDGIVSS